MKKAGKTMLVSFSAAHRQEARLWLEAMAEQGWELVQIKPGHFSRALFQPLEREDLRYDVDIADHFLKDFDKQRAYDDFLAQAGWDLVGQLHGIKFYKSRPGLSPAPIQTDPALEGKRYRKEVLLPGLVTTLILLALCLLLWVGMNLNGPFHLYYLFVSNGFLAYQVLLWGALILNTAVTAWGFWRWRAAAKTSVPSAARIRRVRLRGVITAVFGLVILAAPIPWYVSWFQDIGDLGPSMEEILTWPVVFGEDFGREGSSPYGDIRLDSVFVQSMQVRQSFPLEDNIIYPTTDRLWEERFDCTYGWVADLVVSGLRNDVYDYTPADLSFDESYLDGENRLLLRQGNTVLRLDAPFDLTTEASLDVLRDCLEGEG